MDGGARDADDLRVGHDRPQRRRRQGDHPAVATLATQFPGDFPADPVDRIIAATARSEGMALVSRDERLRASRLVDTIW
jgi:PIN domain nuclease of toxin-antitoxin system